MDDKVKEHIICQNCNVWKPEADGIVGECKHPDNPSPEHTTWDWGYLCDKKPLALALEVKNEMGY